MEYTEERPLKVFTAFSGYDSQCLALKRLGIPFDLVGFSEIDKYAIQAHDVLFPEYKDRNYGDISKIDWEQVPDFDLFTYSYPCTNISNAGKQEGFDEGSGTSSSLLWECRKTIVAKKPKYLLMENVKALLSAKFKPLFMKWQDELASYGYANFVKVLDAQNYGVPQHRERVFMVSILGDNASFHFPEPFPLERKLKDVLEKEVDEKYYLSDRTLNFFFKNSENMKSKGCGFSFKPTVGHGIANSMTTKSSSRMYDNNKQAGRIYDVDGIAPTLDNIASGGNKSPKIVEPLSCAMRGRDLANPSNREAGCVTGQRVEIRGNIANTVTTVQKDSMVVEPQVFAPKRNEYGKSVRKDYESGKLDESRHNMTDLQPRQDGIRSNTITCDQKDNLLFEPMIFGVTYNPNRREFNKGQMSMEICHTLAAEEAKNTSVVWERSKHVCYKITENGKIRAYTDDDRKSGVSELQIDNENSIASTVVTAHTPKCYGESMGFRIRKLTPREVLRLMDVDDEDIDKLIASGISNTQLYKMGGNSIVVGVLYHIFRKLFIDKENENQQLTLF